MKISTNWLKDYININNLDLKELANKITNIGVNVEGISGGTNIPNLVVGEVIEVSNHPDSDHLHVCKVNIGKEILQIVCGAPNVRENLKVIVSLIGAVLPGDFEIKKSKIRGVESFGMLCALSELGLEDEYSGGIHELPENALVGESPFKYLNDSNDVVYTLDLNPNRNDCLSHLGFAYEAASALGIDVKIPNITHSEINDSIKDVLTLRVDSENCKLFTLKKVKDVTIKESPDFIKERLTAVGMRPINNVVDISNYIMLEYGQPLHFYDADKLGKVIGVRMANDGEKVVTLDNKERNLTSKDIVITNGTEIVGIAGVMGGFSTEVDENTKNIIIESAIFNPLLIRNTSIKLDLRSEASLRFEKGLNYEYTYEALERSANMLETYANGKVCKDIISYDKVDKTPKKANVTLEKINAVLGLNLTDEDVRNAFDKLKFKYTGNYEVTIPNRRMDVSIKEDLIEEVGRIYGFHKIVGSTPTQELKKGSQAPRIKYRKDISKILRGLGINEVKTYTLTDQNKVNKYNYENKDIIRLDRPISSDRTHIRVSLISSLLEVYEYNSSRGLNDINIYEISNTYYKDKEEFKEDMKLSILLTGKLISTSWNNTEIKDNFYTLKGIVENLIHYLGLDNRVKYISDNSYNFMHPGITASLNIDGEKVGFFGKLNPIITKKDIYVCEINLEKLMNKKSGKVKYIEPNKFPAIKRDVAFIVDNNVNSSDIVKDIYSLDKKRITECIVFDEYKMDNKKSLAFNLKFEDDTKTLTEEEGTLIFKNIIDSICKKYDAILRDK